MFEKASIFIFTLGLTEGWISTIDGAVVPLPPGVCKIVKHAGDYQPVNFTITSMIRDLNETIAKIRAVNPGIRILLTVSPVPLIATFEDRHVLVSTTYSKSALRVVAEEVVRSDPKSVAYFPSYEMITAPVTKGIYFASDLRSVTPDGVAHVMSVFRRHFLCDFPELPDENQPLTKANEVSTEVSPHDRERFRILSTVVCDEEAIAENVA